MNTSSQEFNVDAHFNKSSNIPKPDTINANNSDILRTNHLVNTQTPSIPLDTTSIVDNTNSQTKQNIKSTDGTNVEIYIAYNIKRTWSKYAIAYIYTDVTNNVYNNKIVSGVLNSTNELQIVANLLKRASHSLKRYNIDINISVQTKLSNTNTIILQSRLTKISETITLKYLNNTNQSIINALVRL